MLWHGTSGPYPAASCPTTPRAPRARRDLDLLRRQRLLCLLAAIDRSRARAAAWLLGPALLAVVLVGEYLVEVLWPDESAIGGGPGSFDNFQVTLVAGFWLILFGTLVLLVASVILPRVTSKARPHGPRSTAA